MLPDRISSLPVHIIDDILKCLPLRDAVRTSILSTQWRYQWLTVPHLVFNREFRDSFLFERRYEKVISRVLRRHKGPIFKFSLFHSRVDEQWLYILSNHPIKDLTLCSDMCRDLPHSLFYFDHIKHLHLGRAYIKLPPTFNGFSALVELKLVNVFISPEDLQKFISKCSMLEFLNICMYEIPSMVLCLSDAPNLKQLNLEFVGIILYPTFKGFSWLVKLSIVDLRSAPEELQRLISKCPRLEFLNICVYEHSIVSCLSDAPNLKQLNLEFVGIILHPTFKGFSWLVKLSIVNLCSAPEELQSLISKCPMLEFLCISMRNDPTISWCLEIDVTNLKDIDLEHVDIKPPTVNGCSQLVKISLKNVCITPEELQRFICKCPMLEYLHISECFGPEAIWCIDTDAPNLKHLHLARVAIKPPPTFEGFSGLIKLGLEGVQITLKELQMFISKCPVLKSCYISKCNDRFTFWCLNIDASNLKGLKHLGIFSLVPESFLGEAYVEENSEIFVASSDYLLPVKDLVLKILNRTWGRRGWE